MIYVLVILTMPYGEPVVEPMVFDNSPECQNYAAWVRRIDKTAQTKCFEVRDEAQG